GVVLSDHPQCRYWNILSLIKFRVASSLRRQYGVDDIEIVVAGVAVISEQIIGVRARSHHLAVRRVRLPVVASRNILRRVAECGVLSHVIYTLAADIDDAAVT